MTTPFQRHCKTIFLAARCPGEPTHRLANDNKPKTSPLASNTLASWPPQLNCYRALSPLGTWDHAGATIATNNTLARQVYKPLQPAPDTFAHNTRGKFCHSHTKPKWCQYSVRIACLAAPGLVDCNRYPTSTWAYISNPNVAKWPCARSAPGWSFNSKHCCGARWRHSQGTDAADLPRHNFNLAPSGESDQQGGGTSPRCILGRNWKRPNGHTQLLPHPSSRPEIFAK